MVASNTVKKLSLGAYKKEFINRNLVLIRFVELQKLTEDFSGWVFWNRKIWLESKS